MGTTPLHCSLLELCRRRIGADREFLSVKNWNQAPMVDFSLFEEYRIYRLRRTLEYVVKQSRFYRRLFDLWRAANIKIEDTSDLATLPFTNAGDIAADPFSFLCISQGMVERAVTFTSSGTIGPRKRVFFSESDIEAIIDYMAAGMKTVADSDDVVQIMLPGGVAFSQGDLLARAVTRMGARPVFTGMFVPPQQQITAILENHSTIVFGETHLIYRMTKLSEKNHDLRELGVRTLFLATSYASPVMMDYLADAWNARISTHYGLTEMGLGLAVDCTACGARHFNELDVIGEVVEPRTGQPLKPGSIGELVFTSIAREAMPLIRYRTGDLAYFGRASEQCESPLRTIGQVSYRVESVIKLRNGMDIHPTLFHEVLFGIPAVIDYELSVDDDNGLETLVFEVEAEHHDELLRRDILSALRDAPSLQLLEADKLAVEVQFKAAGGLQQGAHFKKVIHDLRKRPNVTSTNGLITT